MDASLYQTLDPDPANDFVRLIVGGEADSLRTPELRWLFREYAKLMDREASMRGSGGAATRRRTQRQRPDPSPLRVPIPCSHSSPPVQLDGDADAGRVDGAVL